jgi:predicted O-methyltransferase YrrM
VSEILQPELPWLGDNLLLLDEVRVELERLGIREPVLLRASERSKLERVLVHGTDRAGYPGEKRWCLDSAIAHEDVILATTPEQNREGEADPAVSTSIKKFPLIPEPMLLIYAAAAFEHLRDNHWRFRDPNDKPAALRAVFPIRKLAMPDGWFSTEEGLGYRRMVQGLLWQLGARKHIVEVGCWLGRSTSYIARLCQAHGATLTCVDSWVGSSDRFDVRYRELLASRDIEAEFRAHLAALGVTAQIRREPSLEVARTFAPGSVDLVFLDASHDYGAVAADIAAWRPAVHERGVLAGHDFSERHPGVVAAVEAAARARPRRPHHVMRGPGSLWLIYP